MLLLKILMTLFFLNSNDFNPNRDLPNPNEKAANVGLMLNFDLWPGENVLFFIRLVNGPITGHVTFHLPDGQIYRKTAEPGSPLENLSTSLDLLPSTGADDWINISPNGQWMVLSTERFNDDCIGWPCLAVINADVTTANLIFVDGQVIHSGEFSAISSDGQTVVFPGPYGPHSQDLWVVHNLGSNWTQPALLTGDSPFNFNQEPALSTDGTKLLFSAGPVPYAQEGTAVCEVGIDGTGFQLLFSPEDGPGGTATDALKSPDYAPDGTIVFEADWLGEQIWRLDRQTNTPVLINATFGNDNSPCVLPDGRIVSLWLGNSIHEIKVMNPDGTEYFMLLTGFDVDDIGMGCGQ